MAISLLLVKMASVSCCILLSSFPVNTGDASKLQAHMHPVFVGRHAAVAAQPVAHAVAAARHPRST